MLSFFFHPLRCTVVHGCRINGLGCELYYRYDHELVRIKSVFWLACFNSSKLNLAIPRYRDTALHVLKGFLQHPDTDRTCSPMLAFLNCVRCGKFFEREKSSKNCSVFSHNAQKYFERKLHPTTKNTPALFVHVVFIYESSNLSR